MLGNGFTHLGIGVDLYFAQLVSLAFAFMLMGFASLGSLLTNVAQHSESSDASADTLYLLVGTTLGARTEPFDLFQSANTELACTICFTAYLLWLHFFIISRARQSQVLAEAARAAIISCPNPYTYSRPHLVGAGYYSSRLHCSGVRAVVSHASQSLAAGRD